jgi:hypothetical protein
MKYPQVKLYKVDWDEDEDGIGRRNPRVVCTEADESPKLFMFNGHRMTLEQRNAFGSTHVSKEGKFGRAAKYIGLDAVEAVYFELERLKADEAHIERVLNAVRRELTDIAVLGLNEAKVLP